MTDTSDDEKVMSLNQIETPLERSSFKKELDNIIIDKDFSKCCFDDTYHLTDINYTHTTEELFQIVTKTLLVPCIENKINTLTYEQKQNYVNVYIKECDFSTNILEELEDYYTLGRIYSYINNKYSKYDIPKALTYFSKYPNDEYYLYQRGKTLIFNKKYDTIDENDGERFSCKIYKKLIAMGSVFGRKLKYDYEENYQITSNFNENRDILIDCYKYDCNFIYLLGDLYYKKKKYKEAGQIFLYGISRGVYICAVKLSVMLCDDHYFVNNMVIGYELNKKYDLSGVTRKNIKKHEQSYKIAKIEQVLTLINQKIDLLPITGGIGFVNSMKGFIDKSVDGQIQQIQQIQKDIYTLNNPSKKVEVRDMCCQTDLLW